MIPYTKGCPGCGGSESFPLTDVTRILSYIEQYGTQASVQLLSLVYEKLWMLAASKMAQLLTP